jgi:hypothetical protein
MKHIWHFLITVIGICIIVFFGSLGIRACSEIVIYLFTHCIDLMCHTILFAFGLVGVVIGWFTFCDGLNKLKNK